MREGPDNAEGFESGGEDELEFFDFTAVTRRTKNMHNPKLILEIGSNRGELNALASELASAVNLDAGIGQAGPSLLKIGRIPNSKDLAGFPTREKGPATVEVAWPEKETGARLDLQLLLQLYPVRIPKGHRAFVPVSRYETAKHGPGIRFEFTRISFGRITPRQSGNTGTAKATGTKGSKGPGQKENKPPTPPQNAPEQTPADGDDERTAS